MPPVTTNHLTSLLTDSDSAMTEQEVQQLEYKLRNDDYFDITGVDFPQSDRYEV